MLEFTKGALDFRKDQGLRRILNFTQAMQINCRRRK